MAFWDVLGVAHQNGHRDVVDAFVQGYFQPLNGIGGCTRLRGPLPASVGIGRPRQGAQARLRAPPPWISEQRSQFQSPGA